MLLSWLYFFPRFGIEVADGVDVVHHFVETAPERLGQLAEFPALQKVHVIADDRLGRRVFHVMERELGEKTFTQIA